MSSEEGVIAVLSVVDYVLFAAMLLISAGIGIYFRFAGDKQKTTEEYLMAGKDMSILPVAFSLMASFLSSVTVIGVPAEMYSFGISIAYMNLGYAVGMIISAYMSLPVFFDMQVPTIYEYLERRFGSHARSLASVAFVLQMILYMSVVLYAPALVLSTVAYLPTWVSVVSIGIVCTFYCTLGGMKAVLWTDVFQAILMYIGLFTVLIKGFLDVGFKDVFTIAYERGRFPLPGFDWDPTIRYTMWGILFQSLVLAMSGYSSNQVQVQRLMTVKNLTRAKISIAASFPLGIGFHLLNCLAGIVIFAHFADCDPISSPNHPIKAVDQVLPYYIMTVLGKYPGLPGLCICGVFGASLSTVSSAVNSLTAVTMQDLVAPFLAARGLSPRKVTFVAQLTTMFYGLLCILLTFVVASFGNLVQASLTVFGLLGGPVLGMFLLGMLTERTNEKGVVIGLVTSIVLSSWISFGASAYAPPPERLPVSTEGCPVTNLTGPFSFISNETLFNNSSNFHDNQFHDEDDIFYLYKLSYMWIAPIGFASCCFIGYFSSIIMNMATGETKDVPIELISPFMKRFCKKEEKNKKSDKKKLPSHIKNEKSNPVVNNSNIKESIRL